MGRRAREAAGGGVMVAERTYCEWVWCACWLSCRGIGVPGYTDGGEAMLCEACERERLAERNAPLERPREVTR